MPEARDEATARGKEVPPVAAVEDLQGLQARLESAAELTGRLAHDFGNALTGILGFAELAGTQVPADSLAGRYLREVVGSARHATAWVQRLQLFSRRRTGPYEPANLAAAVTEVEAGLRAQWGPGVVLHTAVPPRLPALALDAASLRQMLVELLENAREAVRGQGVVSLAARRVELTAGECASLIGRASPGRHVEVTFTDTGVGIPPEGYERLFGGLLRSNKIRHRGLGLAVVYGILRAFGGGLRLGPRPDRGSVVTVCLPEVEAETPEPQGRAAPRLLVVDDDPLILGYLTAALQSAGYRVSVAAGGAEALAAYGAAGEPFALVVSDVLMPHMSGVELARRLQQRDPAVKLLFMSSDPAEVARQPGLGHFGLLTKPFRPEALLQAVRAALGRPAAGDTGEHGI